MHLENIAADLIPTNQLCLDEGWRVTLALFTAFSERCDKFANVTRVITDAILHYVVLRSYPRENYGGCTYTRQIMWI